MAGASVLAAVAAGCGDKDLDGAALSDKIEEGLKKQNKVRKVEVKCPAKIERKAQTRASCPFVTDRVAGVIRVVQQDERAASAGRSIPKSVRRRP